MSLLDNKKGLTILSALFLLFACEEPNELPLGISPKQGAVSSHYIEIPIEAEQLLLNSRTLSAISSSPFNTNIYFGRLPDDTFGSLKATAYTNIGAPNSTSIPLLDESTSADSIVLRLKITPPFLGSNFTSSQTLKIYNLPEPIDTTLNSGSDFEYLYYINDKRELSDDYLIGEFNYDTTDIDNNNVLKLHLTQDFADKITDKLKQDTSAFHQQQTFDQFIGSLAFEAGENNTFLLNINFPSNSSKIDLYYPTAANPTNVISFAFAPIGADNQSYKQLPTYYSLETDFSGTALEGIESNPQNTPFQTTDNQAYFRSGVGLLPKISFPELDDFVNSITESANSKVVINSAILEVDSINRKSELNLLAPPQFSFYFVEDQNNKRFQGVYNEPNAGAQMQAQQYISTQGDTLYRYTANIADEIEWFINNKEAKESKNYLQGMFYNGYVDPNGSNLPSWSQETTLYSLIADPQRMVLKIYYTTLESNQGN